MNLGAWLEHTGFWAVSPSTGTSGGGPDEYDDIELPPKRTWLWVLIGIVLLAGASAGGYYFYAQQQELRELEALLEQAPTMPPPERAAALRRVLQSQAHDSFRKDAAAQLGELGDPDAVPLLLAVVEDTGELSQTAAEALGRMADAGRLGEADIARARDRIYPQMQAAQGIARTQFAFSLADQRSTPIC